MALVAHDRAAGCSRTFGDNRLDSEYKAVGDESLDSVTKPLDKGEAIDGFSAVLNAPLLQLRSNTCLMQALFSAGLSVGQETEDGRVTLKDVQQQSLNLSARTLDWRREVEINKVAFVCVCG